MRGARRGREGCLETRGARALNNHRPGRPFSLSSSHRGGPTEIRPPLDPPSHRDLTPNLPCVPAGTRRGDDRVPLRRQTRAAVRVPRAPARHRWRRESERRERPARTRGHRAGAPEDEPVGPDARVRQGPEQAGAPAHDRQTGALHDGHRRRRRVVARRHEGRLHPSAAVEGAVAGVHPQGVRGRNPPLHGAAHRADARAPGPDQALRPVGGVRGLRLPRRRRREQGSRAEARVRRHPLDAKDSRSRRRRRAVPGRILGPAGGDRVLAQARPRHVRPEGSAEGPEARRDGERPRGCQIGIRVRVFGSGRRRAE